MPRDGPRPKLLVATSGWVYEHWWGPFYPQAIPRKDWFRHYAERFRSVEINNTFYRMPGEKAVQTWKEQSPDGFTFAFKASRYITHMKRLRGGPRPVRDFLGKLKPLGEKLGPVLFQLPPNMPLDLARLRAFLQDLPQGEAQYVCEFRHPSWHVDETFDLLGEHGVGFCIHDIPAPTPVEVTGQVVYLRFHGTHRPYAGEYGRERLAPWAKRMATWHRAGHDVYAYFNNDEEAMAILDAEELGDQVERLTGVRVLAA